MGTRNFGLWRITTIDHELVRLERLVTRMQEIQQVAETERFVWLAGQMDELHSDVTSRLDVLQMEVGTLRRVWSGVLIAILVGLVAIPVSIIWAAALSGNG